MEDYGVLISGIEKAGSVEAYVEEVCQDTTQFRNLVYTPISLAISEIQQRWDSSELRTLIEDSVTVPTVFTNEPTFSFFRQLCTPNFETHRFITISDSIGFTPIIVTYVADKFTAANILKLAFARLKFCNSIREGDAPSPSLKIIDIVKSDGKVFTDIQTVWGERLDHFHERIFRERYPHVVKDQIYDISSWYLRNGGRAKDYYDKLMLLFVQNTILFDNFILEDAYERRFIKEIFLPAFIRAWILTKLKPLVVSLEPTDMERDEFWTSYPENIVSMVYTEMNHD